jgi:hypothetical protein
LAVDVKDGGADARDAFNEGEFKREFFKKKEESLT